MADMRSHFNCRVLVWIVLLPFLTDMLFINRATKSPSPWQMKW